MIGNQPTTIELRMGLFIISALMGAVLSASFFNGPQSAFPNDGPDVGMVAAGMLTAIIYGGLSILALINDLMVDLRGGHNDNQKNEEQE